jgi:hypothetical protein
MSKVVLFQVTRAFVFATSAATAACSGSPTAPSATPAVAAANPTSGPAVGTAPTTPPPAGNSPTPPPSSDRPVNITAVGSYRLVSVNGTPVPGTFDSFSPTPGVRMEMVAVRGLIILNDDGTYLHEYETRLRSSNRADIIGVKETVGMYSLNAGEMTFSPYQGTTYSPSYSPGRIEVVTEAPGLDGQTDRFVWRYEK